MASLRLSPLFNLIGFFAVPYVLQSIHIKGTLLGFKAEAENNDDWKQLGGLNVIDVNMISAADMGK